MKQTGGRSRIKSTGTDNKVGRVSQLCCNCTIHKKMKLILVFVEGSVSPYTILGPRRETYRMMTTPT